MASAACCSLTAASRLRMSASFSAIRCSYCRRVDSISGAASDSVSLITVLQLGQRPDAHADQFRRRRHGHLGDLLDHVGHELARAERAAEPGIPHDGVDAALVEVVDDPADPGGRAIDPLGDFAVAYAAGREQNHPRVAAVGDIRQLPLHAMQLLAFRQLRPPCHNPVHDSVLHFIRVAATPEVENIFARKPPPDQRLRINATETKLTQWKRH